MAPQETQARGLPSLAHPLFCRCDRATRDPTYIRAFLGTSAALVAALILLAGCGAEPAAGPPEIQYGLEECGYCRMIVSEEKFAAAIVDAAGAATSFDDVGCLIEHLRERLASPEKPAGGASTESIWVHDHAAGGWIVAQSAWFVHDQRVTTPMGYGLLAFASRQQAEAYASERAATVETWGRVAGPSPGDEQR